MCDGRSLKVEPGEPSPGGSRTTSTAAAIGAGAVARHNLPSRLTPFIGREREITEVAALLDTHRLVTLVGAPGVGKTRLSLEVARSARGEFPYGIWLVELAPLSDATNVPTVVAAALGIREQPGQPLTATLTEHLRSRRLLLLLDNCEHLVGPAASLAELLLQACPGLHILATSREPLTIEGEETWRVPSLTLPTAAQAHRGQHEGRAALDESEAARLFVVRVRAAARSFELNDRNVPAIVQICTQLDGIPLALELAAVRVRALSVQEIAARLSDRFRLLSGGSRSALPHQQTLRGTIDWSYDLLTAREQVLLRRLAVFAGGWTLEAAESVCAGAELVADDVLDTLVSLVEKSLVQAEQDDARGMRYHLLEIIRQYALDRLREADEETWLRRRHLAWASDLPRRSGDMVHVLSGPAWMAGIRSEIDNLRAALAWSVSDADPTSARSGLTLATDLHGFWFARFQMAEGYRWLERTLAADAQYESAEHERRDGEGQAAVRAGTWGAHPRIAALNRLANLAEDVWSREEAFCRADEIVALARALGDRLGEGHALVQLGNYARRFGQFERSARLCQEALAILRECSQPLALWRPLRSLGWTYMLMGDYRRAESPILQCLELSRSAGYLWGEGELLRLLGDLKFRQGDLQGSTALLEEALSVLVRLDAPRGRTWTLLTLGQVYRARGDTQGAARCFSECLVACYEAGDRPGMARSLEGLAAAVTTDEEHQPGADAQAAAHLLAAAAALREASTSPIAPSEQPARDRALAIIRTNLGDEALDTAWDAGLTMPLEQVLKIGAALARQIRANLITSDTQAKSTSAVPAHLEPLTPREREVAILVGRGYTNRQIAEQMVVSERTVEVYARNVRERLGLTTRAQMVAWMIQHGLPGPVD